MLEYLEYSDNDILERVDEYSLYCHYLGFDPLIGKKYSSPLRLGDNDPSFAIFEKKYSMDSTNSEFLWKDQALPLRGPKDIFDLVVYKFGLDNRLKAYIKVCSDFGLGGATSMDVESLILKEIQYAEPIEITIKSHDFTRRDLAYWKQYNVSDVLLKHYNTTSIECYWLTKTQQYPSYPKGLGFAYRIFNKYQLYFPFHEKKRKFRNDWVETCIPGLKQLTGTDTCIITKSYKDVMCLRGFGYDAISPRGENIMLPKECIEYLQKRYKRVVTLFDNDGKHKAEFYPFEEVHIPIETGQKDPTDYCSYYGIDATSRLLKEII